MSVDITYRRDLFRRIAEAKLACAKQALASPFMFPEGTRLASAIENAAKAKAELREARRAWRARIAPAKGWAKDPFA